MDEMNAPDADIEREIRSTVAAVPSPEFLARVRTEIANRPVAQATPPWMWAIGLACLAIGVGTVVSRQSMVDSRESIVDSRRAPVESPQSPVDGRPSIVDSRVAPVESRRPTVASQRPGRAARASQSVEPPMPEVLISPDDTRAFQQFVASVREGKFEVSFDEPMPPVTP